MKRRVGLLCLFGWTMGAACSGGSEETRGPAAGRSMSVAVGTVPMKIGGKLGRSAFQASGAGECATSATSSIYGVPATQWHAMFGSDNRSDIQHLNLTVWRPRSGAPDMVNLYFQSGETTHRIATVKGGELAGSGTPEVRVEDKGGILTVTGQDDHGHPLQLSVECERFDEVVAEGG